MTRGPDRRLRLGAFIWWLNVVAGLVLTIGTAAASVFLFLLLDGTVTQPAPLDREETAGQAFLLAVIALVFAALTTWFLVTTLRLTPRERAEKGASWLP